MREKLYKLKLIFIPCKSNRWRPKFLNSKFLFYYAVILLILKLAIIPFLFYFPETVFFADLTKTNLIEFTNVARQHFGLPSLRENSVLSEAAYFKARDMIEKGYFAHYSPQGISPWHWLETSGYVYQVAGENLAIGFLESEQVHNAWMNSVSHRDNILNPNYKEIGIAVVKGNFQGSETALVVQFLGSQKYVAPEIKEIEQVAGEVIEEEIMEEVIEEIEEGSSVIPAKAGIQDPDDWIPNQYSVVAEHRVGNDREREENEENEEMEERGEIIGMEENKEIIEEKVKEKIKRSPGFLLFNFIMSDYYDWLQRIIYGSLVLIIFSLLIVVYCDMFIYRRFKIDYKDVVFKAVGFSALWFVLIYLDKLIIIQLISQNFRIY